MNDLTGQGFGKLTVLGDSGKRNWRYMATPKKDIVMWTCLCDCGKTTEISENNLKSGNNKSCGCLRKDRTYEGYRWTHRGSKTRLYGIWRGMKSRCKYVGNNAFKWYGGKGIRVCAEWENSFISFRNWALNNGYENNLTIDRINSNGNYEPSNCRWITLSENSTRASREKAEQFRYMQKEVITLKEQRVELLQQLQSLGQAPIYGYYKMLLRHAPFRKIIENIEQQVTSQKQP